MSDAISIYQRELDAMFSTAPQYKFDDTTIEQVFGDKVVSGEHLLQTTQWYGVGGTNRGGSENMKQYLLDYLHHRLKARSGLGPILYFRFVTREEIRHRMISVGLDPSLFLF